MRIYVPKEVNFYLQWFDYSVIKELAFHLLYKMESVQNDCKNKFTNIS